MLLADVLVSPAVGMRAVVGPVRISVHCRPRLCGRVRVRAAGRSIIDAVAAAAGVVV